MVLPAAFQPRVKVSTDFMNEQNLESLVPAAFQPQVKSMDFMSMDNKIMESLGPKALQPIVKLSTNFMNGKNAESLCPAEFQPRVKLSKNFIHGKGVEFLFQPRVRLSADFMTGTDVGTLCPAAVQPHDKTSMDGITGRKVSRKTSSASTVSSLPDFIEDNAVNIASSNSSANLRTRVASSSKVKSHSPRIKKKKKAVKVSLCCLTGRIPIYTGLADLLDDEFGECEGCGFTTVRRSRLAQHMRQCAGPCFLRTGRLPWWRVSCGFWNSADAAAHQDAPLPNLPLTARTTNIQELFKTVGIVPRSHLQ